jgi:hypothetical protein
MTPGLIVLGAALGTAALNLAAAVLVAAGRRRTAVERARDDDEQARILGARDLPRRGPAHALSVSPGSGASAEPPARSGIRSHPDLQP